MPIFVYSLDVNIVYDSVKHSLMYYYNEKDIHLATGHILFLFISLRGLVMTSHCYYWIYHFKDEDGHYTVCTDLFILKLLCV